MKRSSLSSALILAAPILMALAFRKLVKSGADQQYERYQRQLREGTYAKVTDTIWPTPHSVAADVRNTIAALRLAGKRLQPSTDDDAVKPDFLWLDGQGKA